MTDEGLMRIPSGLVGEADAVIRFCNAVVRKFGKEEPGDLFGPHIPIGEKQVVLDGPGLPVGDHVQLFAPMYTARTVLGRESSIEFARQLLELDWGALALMGQSSMGPLRDPTLRAAFLASVAKWCVAFDRLGARFLHTGLQPGTIWELPTNVPRALAKEGVPAEALAHLTAARFMQLVRKQLV